MNKKIIITLLAIVLVFIIIFLNKNFKEENKNLNNNLATNYLTSTVLGIENNYVTLQDENNIIYTFFMSDATLLEVGENIEIEYKGEIDVNNKIQNNEVLSFKILSSVSGEVPDLWNDSGLFSKFYSHAYKKLESMSLDEKIGQILLVRVPVNNQIEDLKKYNFGGYLLFQRDFDSKTKQEVVDMIKNYQANSNIPLLIAVDEEGGKVSRISNNLNLVDTPFKFPRELYLEGNFNLIHQDTVSKSKILEDLGINLNLAPVVDVSTDKTDYMYERTIGEDTNVTSQYSKTVIEASKLGHVSYTLKHFPGYGNNQDTHLGVSIDTRSLESIKENDLPPFKSGIDADAEAVLVSHNVVQAIDPDKPASLSANVHNLLRKDLAFTGIIITDDLSMNAVDPNTAVIDAILAGNDLLIVTDYEQSINQIKNGLKNNTLNEELINKMAFRVLAWKYYKGLIIPNQK